MATDIRTEQDGTTVTEVTFEDGKRPSDIESKRYGTIGDREAFQRDGSWVVSYRLYRR
jgi:hypothetical protein